MQRIKEFLKINQIHVDEVIKLLGDASSRSYYKIVSNSNTFCLAHDVGDFIQNKDFIKSTLLFKKHIRVPNLEIFNNPEFVLQEYIGNVSFLTYITQFPEKRLDYLKRAIDDICKYQDIDKEKFKLVSTYEFDDKKIEFEFDLAVKYFVSDYLKYKIPENVLTETKKIFLDFYRQNMEVICHRDYHSRNLMIKNEELIHIDYQDARLGPNTYDLVSLLEDCYIKYSDQDKEFLKKYFFEVRKLTSFKDFEIKYNITAAQRIFKALGSFAFLKIEKNKNQYEKNIGFAFENLRQVLEKIESFRSFKDHLLKAYYES